ncbi:hypothetical protein Tco_1244348 [Tanacetum coccineum]
MTPRSCLRWKPTGKIFKTVGLRWVPTGKIFTSSTTKVDSEPQNGSNEDITNQYECEQTLDVSAGTLNLSAAMTSVHNSSGLAPPRQMTSDHNSSELGIHDHSNELSSSKLVPKVVPPADKTATSRQELELLFHHHITMLRIKHKFIALDTPTRELLKEKNRALEDMVNAMFLIVLMEIGKSSRIDDEVVQDQRQRDDNDLQDERQDQPNEEEVEPRRCKRARTEKSFRPDFVSFMVENEPTSYREAVTFSEWLNRKKPLKAK